MRVHAPAGRAPLVRDIVKVSAARIGDSTDGGLEVAEDDPPDRRTAVTLPLADGSHT